LLAELRARVAALVQKLEAAAEPALLEPGPSAGPGSDTEGMA
jgi:hypothetical protein